MGERFLDAEEVVGSIPADPTIYLKLLRKNFLCYMFTFDSKYVILLCMVEIRGLTLSGVGFEQT